ncbi:conserved exported hypothetical protein [Enterobacterales bacterium 8AC]|nr:conserved exported hypothetical protein [Enterobacterales bacterium 8AC]
MKKMIIVAATLSLGLTHFIAAAEPLSIEPGLWRDGGTIMFNGQALTNSPKDDEDEECVSAEQAKDLRAAMASSYKDSGCEITSWDRAPGDKLEIGLACVNEEGKSKGKLSGVYTSTSYDLKGRLDGTHIHAGPYFLDMHMYGKRIGECH